MVKAKEQLKKPVWLKYTEQEVKEIIIKLAEKDQNMTAEKIGLILRDSYGIPKAKIYGIKISKVLKEAGKYTSPDLVNLDKKTTKLQKHLEKNHGDKRTGRSLIITRAKLKLAKDYFSKKQ
jgi:ribosomal protein S15P/S13E